MRVARAHESLDERREVVVELLHFIRDFNGLDTTVLVEKTADLTFLEAAEAVLKSAVGPWKSVDALRDFAVQALYGERPADKALVERARPGRVSPFSVPLPLLRSLAPNPGQFDIRNLRTLSMADALRCEGVVGEDTRWSVQVTPGEAWLVTTMWAQALPKKLRYSQIRIVDLGANRILHDGKLWALLSEQMPCFWWLGPHTPLEMLITRQREEQPTEILLALEGWRYTVR